ncbi:hypothetical protein DSM112329_03402 [Paraconexibacter sp. AEG42_29]|uniref:DUF58 domain-containing protein n=1 Tax=Paraconexibacter sp. AEG42_29 TaxID=2997339 RepID=A0AAU7AXT3_9ACTN
MPPDRRSGTGHTRALPTTGLLLVLTAGATLHLLGRTSASGWIALASAALLALPVVALLTRPRLGGLQVTRLIHGQPVAGQRSDVTLTLSNAGRRMTPATTVVDHLPGHEQLVVAFGALRPGASASVRGERLAVQRTASETSTATLRTTSPVGLIGTEVPCPVPGRVVVHPEPATPRGRPAGAGGLGASRAAAPGPGTEILGLRDWRHGESARSVAARASARHGRPLVLEREREDAATLVILVGFGHGPAWEAALSDAASMAVSALRSGRPLALHGLPGTAQTAKGVLDAFAAADDSPALHRAALDDALRQAGHGGVLVVVAGTAARADTDGLLAGLRRAAARRRCAVVVLDERADD